MHTFDSEDLCHKGFKSITSIITKCSIPPPRPKLPCSLCGLKIDIERDGDRDGSRCQDRMRDSEIDIQENYFLRTIKLMVFRNIFKCSRETYLGCTTL